MRKIILLVVAVLLTGCGIQREAELQRQMDAEMALCRQGAQQACMRYQMLAEQYRTEHVPRCGLLGLPCAGNALINVQSN